MTPPSIPPNAYTYAPEQHKNLFLGSLQLLFWLVFRPTAWKNHIQRLDPYLDEDFSLLQLLKHQRWRRWDLWRFLFQAFIMLPILASVFTGAVSLSFGTSLEDVAGGVAGGVAVAVAFGITFVVAGDVAGGVAVAVAVAIAGDFAFVLPFVVAFVVVGVVTFGVAVRDAERVAFSVAFGVVGVVAFLVAFVLPFGVTVGVAGLVAGLVALVVGLWINWWRSVLMSALLMPWHFLLYHIDQDRVGRFPSLLNRHLAFWDEWQYLPIWGLEQHLLLVLEHSPLEGQAALNYLSTSRQRWAAQSAQIELDARQLEQCADADAVGRIHRSVTVGELVGPASALLRSFNSISEDVEAALNQSTVYNQRLVLKAVSDRLDKLIRELTRSSDKYAVRFRPIAQRWNTIIQLHIDELTKAVEQRQEIDSPYIIGVPLTERQEIFVGRTDVTVRIEQLLRDRRRPPLLLYGQRRMGKTSLLNNLGRLLPSSIVPLFVDL